MPRKEKSISGERFGNVVAIKSLGRFLSGENLRYKWQCVCDCGKITDKWKLELTRKNRNGLPINCGCLDTHHRSEVQKKMPSGESSFNALYDNYKRGALRRGYEFSITKDQFKSITKQDCHYCGKEPQQKAYWNGCNGEYIYNGIDRKDNVMGYIIENSLPCCWFCNQIKGTMSYEEMLDSIRRIYTHLKLQEM